MVEILMKMFYGGVFVGALIVLFIVCAIALIILEIKERKEKENEQD